MSKQEITRDEAYKNIEKYLGEPFLDDFTENTLRIRRNLLIASSISLTYKLGNLTIKDASFLGTKFEGVTPELIDMVLMILVSYLLVHFITNSWSQFWEWKLRLTGVWNRPDLKQIGISQAGDGSPSHDSANNPRNSTMFSWFQNQIRVGGNSVKNTKGIDTEIAQMRENLSEKDISEARNLSKMILEKYEETLKELTQLEVRLTRFHKSFFQFQFFQLFRLFVLEWGLPIILGLWAIGLLINW